ncbi:MULTISPECIES: dicarboxylate/amino acid:cation symporter [Enterocloster]|uniref:Na+/H+-dicarboxylate symporter n=1 Tax=Enterocloster lavalensis TaxID=460384 RepID=A0A1I0AFM3_9FIRM|nr:MULTISPECIES: dicarboxylate/amino acid:cation symporter [Enterocloster]MBS5605774.1 dicarboxylate/amino acid:cation symporter [Enterocloster asparagiformis]MCB6344520.1 dicarboxylate/amino acid:cation symporter [Enterocloster lavalensis]MDR3759806.1 dicarboxylate/amino acid:cation symporter [Enterocloster sp.]PST33312.1 dicarboxylate/amino acid:cation symporter [Enterocloster lavalensis]SES92966.1 Na+/H+-dicarboxylate symporter [Enterocloster lavalensis]
MDKKRIWKSYRFPIILVMGIIVGALLGVTLGEKATVLKPLGDIFLNLMFTIVVPMVYVSITTAVGNMVNMKRLGKILGNLVVTFIITGMFAAALVLVVVNIWPPAANTTIQLANAEMQEAASVGDLLVNSLTVNDFSGLMSRNNMLPIIVFAILSGVCVSACGGEESPAGRLLNNLNDIIFKMVDVIMKLAPIGLGAYFANLVGEFGPELIGDYGRAMVIYYPMCLVYVVIAFPAYTYFAGGMTAVKRMLKHILSPALTAFATQSSVAAIPANMEACRKIGVPEDISNIVLPMGATMHMDGSVLSSIIKISFLFGIFGQPFTGVGTYAMSVVVAILSAFVLSGAPGGGLVGEMLIVSLFGFPAEAFPLIATLGFLFDPAATCLNSSGDTIASMMITRMVEGRDWLAKRIASGEAEA